MNLFDVEIVYMDGVTELVTQATQSAVHDGILSIYHDSPDQGIKFGVQTHLGSYPTRNLRRWRKIAK